MKHVPNHMIHQEVGFTAWIWIVDFGIIIIVCWQQWASFYHNRTTIIGFVLLQFIVLLTFQTFMMQLSSDLPIVLSYELYIYLVNHVNMYYLCFIPYIYKESRCKQLDLHLVHNVGNWSRSFKVGYKGTVDYKVISWNDTRKQRYINKHFSYDKFPLHSYLLHIVYFMCCF